jgi:transcriptional regulator NrdR family protein
MGAIREVRKRDNRVVPFDETKIADAIYKAIRSVGRGDRPLAQELAAAVTHFIEKKFPEGIPGIEDIQDQVETVLIETGNAEIAKAYILYRNKRSAVREVLQVRKPASEGPLDPSGGPQLVEDRGGVVPWSKSKIAAALIREADLEVDTAEEIASAVERKVFSSGIRRISTSLIRELVDNELFERGFGQKLRKQAPLGLPKYNLEQIIFGTDHKEGFTFPKTPLEVREFIAAQILEQYGLQEVFSPAVADAHREGRLHLHGLGDVIRFDRLRWDLKLPQAAGGISPGAGRLSAYSAEGPEGLEPLSPLEAAGGEGAEGAGSFLDLADLSRKLAHLAHFVAGEIVLSQPAGLLLDRTLGPGDEMARVEAVYGRLAELGMPPLGASRAGGVGLVLELDLAPAALPWLRALAERPPLSGPSLRLRLSRGDPSDRGFRAALEMAVALFGRGESIEFLPARAAPGREGGGAPRLCPAAAAITVNLPRAAFRSGSQRRGSIEREIEEVLEIAVRGHLERRRFLERLGANRENPLWDLLGRPADRRGRSLIALAGVEFPVSILGLNECVKFLTGHELHQDPRAKQAGLEIVEAMARKLNRDARGLGLRLVLREARSGGELGRLEESDRRRHPESEEIDRGRAAPAGSFSGAAGSRYSDGVRMHRSAPKDPLRRIEHLALFLELVVPGGLIDDSPELRSGGEELIQSLLEESLPCLWGGAGGPGSRPAATLPGGGGP